jgi:hypothetical protein
MNRQANRYENVRIESFNCTSSIKSNKAFDLYTMVNSDAIDQGQAPSLTARVKTQGSRIIEIHRAFQHRILLDLLIYVRALQACNWSRQAIYSTLSSFNAPAVSDLCLFGYYMAWW